MKTAFLTLVLVLIGLAVLAQKNSHGVYVTATDFVNDHLTIVSPQHAVKLKYDGVVIRQKGRGERYSKSTVFGARTCRGVFRFQKNKDYKLVNTDYFFLYHQSIPFGGDTGSYDDVFYFSMKPDSEIIPLTKENLKLHFIDNQKFLAMIETLFRTDRHLGDFSPALNRYTLIYFYEESLKYSELSAAR